MSGGASTEAVDEEARQLMVPEGTSPSTSVFCSLENESGDGSKSAPKRNSAGISSRISAFGSRRQSVGILEARHSRNSFNGDLTSPFGRQSPSLGSVDLRFSNSKETAAVGSLVSALPPVCEGDGNPEKLLSTPGPMQVSELDTPLYLVAERKGALLLAGSNAAARLGERPLALKSGGSLGKRRSSLLLPAFPEGASVSLMSGSSRVTTKNSQSSAPPLGADSSPFLGSSSQAQRREAVSFSREASSPEEKSSETLDLHSNSPPRTSPASAGGLSSSSLRKLADELSGAGVSAQSSRNETHSQKEDQLKSRSSLLSSRTEHEGHSTLGGAAPARSNGENGNAEENDIHTLLSASSIAASQALIKRTREVLGRSALSPSQKSPQNREGRGLAAEVSALTTLPNSLLRRDSETAGGLRVSTLSSNAVKSDATLETTPSSSSASSKKQEVKVLASSERVAATRASRTLAPPSEGNFVACSRSSVDSSSFSKGMTLNPSCLQKCQPAESRSSTTVTGAGGGGGIDSAGLSSPPLSNADPQLSFPGRYLEAFDALNESKSQDSESGRGQEPVSLCSLAGEETAVLRSSLALSEVEAVAGFLSAEVEVRELSRKTHGSSLSRRDATTLPTLLTEAAALCAEDTRPCTEETYPSNPSLSLEDRSISESRLGIALRSAVSRPASSESSGAVGEEDDGSCHDEEENEMLDCTADFGRGGSRMGESSSAKSSSLMSSPSSTPFVFSGSLRRTDEAPAASFTLSKGFLSASSTAVSVQNPLSAQRQKSALFIDRRETAAPESLDPNAAASLDLTVESNTATLAVREARLRLRDAIAGLFRHLDGKLRLSGLEGSAYLWRVAVESPTVFLENQEGEQGRAPSSTDKGRLRRADESLFWKELEATEKYVQLLVKSCAEAVDRSLEALRARGEAVVRLEVAESQQRIAATRATEHVAQLRKTVESLTFDLQTSRAASADLQSQLESAAGVYRQQAQQQRKIDSLQQQVQSLKERLKEKESQLRQRDSEISELEKERALAIRLQQQRQPQPKGFLRRASVGTPPLSRSPEVLCLERDNAALKSLLDQKTAAFEEEVEALKTALREEQQRRSVSPALSADARFAEQEKRHAAQVVTLEAETEALRRSLKEERARRLKGEANFDQDQALYKNRLNALQKSKEEESSSLVSQLEVEVQELRKRPSREEFEALQEQLAEMQEQVNPLKMLHRQKDDSRLMIQCDRALQKMKREKLHALLKCLPGGLPLAVSNFPSVTSDDNNLVSIDQVLFLFLFGHRYPPDAQLLKSLRRRLRLQGQPEIVREFCGEKLREQKILFLAKAVLEARAQAKALSNYASLRQPLIRLLAEGASVESDEDAAEVQFQIQELGRRLHPELLHALIPQEEAEVSEEEEAAPSSEALLQRLERVQFDYLKEVDALLTSAAQADSRLVSQLRTRMKRAAESAKSVQREEESSALTQRQTQFLQELRQRLSFNSEEECFSAVSLALRKHSSLLNFFKIICQHLSIPHATATFARVEAEILRLLEQQKQHCELLHQQQQFMLQQQTLLLSSNHLLASSATPSSSSKVPASEETQLQLAHPAAPREEKRDSSTVCKDKTTALAKAMVAAARVAEAAQEEKCAGRDEFHAVLKALESLASSLKRSC